MFKPIRKEIQWGGRSLVLETGKMARQANGAVVATYGQSSVLCTVVAEKTPQANLDFFPLSVYYQERSYAVGRIPGGFFKREGRPSEKETLTSRLIDRPIRPLFPEGFSNETQVICTLLSCDPDYNPDVLGMIAASAALTISGIPFLGPIGGARVGYKSDTGFILNPTEKEIEESSLDLVVAGTSQGVLMVESEANELSESVMLDAVMFGHQQYQSVIDLIIAFAEEAAQEPWELVDDKERKQALYDRVSTIAYDKLVEAYKITNKQERVKILGEIKNAVFETLSQDEDVLETDITKALKGLQASIVRKNILVEGKRIDGRDKETVRPISTEVAVLPRAHGSSLFTRGETQALVVATLGTTIDEQIVDSIKGEYREHFMLHYNFPPFSVGEVGRLAGPGRREIGHGRLAWRAVRPLLPTKEEFPYAIRVVSEITESNGSSSMATVCGTSLALMDAGVPLKSPIAGVAMGLIKEKDQYAVITDILGDEDHLGDMDFKVAGTERGITALQMDIKITSITKDIMEVALKQALRARLHVLKEMEEAIQEPRQALSLYAPSIKTIMINPEKIRDLIGPGGRVIREICEETGAKIDVQQDGKVVIAAENQAALTAALNLIKGVSCEPEIGEIYEGKVVNIVEFGAFVNFLGSRDGLVHISELGEDRPKSVTDILKVGDVVKVKVLNLDARGKVKLSMKGIPDKETS